MGDASRQDIVEDIKLVLEASTGGMKVGRITDPLYKDSYFGITPPTFILPVEAPDTKFSGMPYALLSC